MISIGGVIGAGLFVGSGAIIQSTGPAAILSYVLGGLVVVLVMRMLGEMAVLNPDSGSFSTYAHQAIGPWAGYTGLIGLSLLRLKRRSWGRIYMIGFLLYLYG